MMVRSGMFVLWGDEVVGENGVLGGCKRIERKIIVKGFGT